MVSVNLLDFWIPGEKTKNIEPDVARWEQNFFVWKNLVMRVCVKVELELVL